jgi:hypothetical protein
MIEQITQIQASFSEVLQKIVTEEALKELEIQYLGKK